MNLVFELYSLATFIIAYKTYPNIGDNILYSVLIGSISLIGLLGVSIDLKKNRFN